MSKEMTLFSDKERGARIARLFCAMRLVLLIFFPIFAWTGVAFSIGNEACLKCHGNRDILKMSREERLKMVTPTPGKQEVEKGKLTLYVDVEKFRSTVHRELQCVDCHTGIEALPHPLRMGMVNCAQCHEEIVAQYDKSKHAKVSQRLCFECHNPHATTSFKE